MSALLPTVCPQTTVELAPNEAPSLIRVLAYTPCTGKCARGVTTLVNTQEGPQNTLSSSSTPS